jgi:hypothetical protein
MANTKMTTSELRSVAVAAQCDPRTVAKVLAGGKVMPMVKERIKFILKARAAKVIP